MDFNSLTDDQKARAKECKNADELVAFANAEGLELTDEQLEEISGGWGKPGDSCSRETGYYDD